MLNHHIHIKHIAMEKAKENGTLIGKVNNSSKETTKGVKGSHETASGSSNSLTNGSNSNEGSKPASNGEFRYYYSGRKLL